MDGKVWGSISGCVKVYEGLSGLAKICRAICTQKASSDNGFGNGRFLGSGQMPEKVFAFRGSAEFTFSYKLLNHLFSTLAVRCRRDFACLNESRIICLRRFLCCNSHFHFAYLAGNIAELFFHFPNGLVTAFLDP